MSELEQAVCDEVEYLHRFFVDWFSGTVDEKEVDRVLVPRLDDETFYVTPDGHRLGGPDLVAMFRHAHGTNPDFRIEIRDVKIMRTFGDYLLVTYTEWQKGARASENPDNARVTTVLLERTQPFRWLHIHETWLPEAVGSEQS